jgi:hypothetical protein
MKKSIRLVAVLVALVLFVGVAYAEEAVIKTRRADDTEQRWGYQYPAPVAECPVASFATIATPTLTVGTAVAVKLPSLACTADDERVMKAVRIGAINGVLNFGNASITSSFSPFNIASGSYKDFPIDGNDPAIYVISQTGTQTVPLQAW